MILSPKIARFRLMLGTGINLPRSSGIWRLYSHFKSPVAASMRLNVIAGIRQIHHALVNQRRGFLNARTHAAGPDHFQICRRWSD